jgi:hypothetical protein
VKLHAHVVACFGLVLDLKILWVQACDRYDRSVQLNWNSPQVFITTPALGVSIGVLILCNVYYMCCFPGKRKENKLTYAVPCGVFFLYVKLFIFFM